MTGIDANPGGGAIDEFYLTGKAEPVDDQAARAQILRDAKHMADASEIVFELRIDRIMHTRWEYVLTPQMHSVHRKWRAPADGYVVFPR